MISIDQLETAIRAVLERDPECFTDRVIKQAAEALTREPEWAAETDPRCQFPTRLLYDGPDGHVAFDRSGIRWRVGEIRAALSAA